MRRPCITTQLRTQQPMTAFSFAGNDAAPFTSLPSPPLMVSDNHEMVDYNTPGSNVQWQHTIGANVPPGPHTGVNLDPHGRHRVFLWAMNRAPSPPPVPTNIGITIQNTSSAQNIQVSSVRAIGGAPDEAGDMAACLLTDELPLLSNGTVLTPGQIWLAYSLPWAFGATVGAQADFLVNPHTAYRVRTAFGPSLASLIQQTGVPQWPYKKPRNEHPRGGWDFSEILITPEYTIWTLPMASPGLFYNLNWPEPGAFDEKISADQNQCTDPPPPLLPSNCAASNRAPYGAIMHIKLTVTNNADCSQYLEIGIGNHQATGRIFGAGRFQNECEFRTPHLDPDNYCVIGYYNAPANSGSWVYIDFAIAGGSTSPVVLTVRPVATIGRNCSP